MLWWVLALSLLQLVKAQDCGSGSVNVTVVIYSDRWTAETSWAVYGYTSYWYLRSSYASVADVTSWSGCLSEGDNFIVYLDDTLIPDTKYGYDKFTYSRPGDGFTGSTNGYAVFVDGAYVGSDAFGPYYGANTWNGMEKGWKIANSSASAWFSDTPTYCLYPPEYEGYANYICYFQTNSFYQEALDPDYYSWYGYYYGHNELNPSPTTTSLSDYRACKKLELTITSTGSDFQWQLIKVDNSSDGSVLDTLSGDQGTLTFSDDCYFDSYIGQAWYDSGTRQAYLYLGDGFSGTVSMKVDGTEVTNGPVSSLTGPTYVRTTHTSTGSTIETQPCFKTIKIDIMSDAYVKEFTGYFLDFNDYYNYYRFTANGFTSPTSTNLSYVVCLSTSSNDFGFFTYDSYADGLKNGAIYLYADFDPLYNTTKTDYGPQFGVFFGVDSSGTVGNVSEYKEVKTCASGESLLRIGFSPDQYPEQTSFLVQGQGSVSNFSESYSIYNNYYTYFSYYFKSTDSNFEYPIDFCVAPGQYSVSFVDSDGFCCSSGYGYANIYFNGTMLGTVSGDFTGSKSVSVTAKSDGSAEFSSNPPRTFVVKIKPDLYPQDISWVITGSGGQIMASKAYTSMDYSTQTETVSLVSGKYSFVISDYAADGICCNSGSGYFTLGIQQDDGSTYTFYTDSGKYGSGETVKFLITTSGNATIDDGSCATGSSKFVMRIWPDAFPQETSWSIASSTGVIQSYGYLTYTDSPYYEYSDCLTNVATYFLTVSDSSGDGMCCSYGIGKYSLQVGNGEFAKNLTNPSKGDFGYSETLSFKVNKTGFVTQTKDVNGIAFTVTVNPDQYPQEISWVLYSGNSSTGSLLYNTLVVSGSSSLDNAVALKTNTSYRFIMSDSYGDGICCEWGFGNYSINVNESALYLSDGMYGEYQIVDFFIAKGNYSVTSVVTAVQCAASQVRLILNLTYDDYPRETSWYLYDIVGKATTLRDSGNGAGQTSVFKSWCLGAGEYMFSVTDSKEDGICCTFGNGMYQLQTNENTLYSSGGMFDGGENVTVKVSVTGGTKSIIANKVSTGGKKSALGFSPIFFLQIVLLIAGMMFVC